MCLFQYDDDPEPEERDPAGSLYVPVRPGTSAMVARLFRTPLGARTAVGFTTPGPADRHARSGAALDPALRVDPPLAGRAAGSTAADRRPDTYRPCGHHTLDRLAGVPYGTGHPRSRARGPDHLTVSYAARGTRLRGSVPLAVSPSRVPPLGSYIPGRGPRVGVGRGAGSAVPTELADARVVASVGAHRHPEAPAAGPPLTV